jgi:hypothetical protein
MVIFFSPILQGNIIEGGPVHHLAAHFGEKSFALIGIFFEKVIGYYSTQHCITKELQPFIVLIAAFFYGTVAEGCFIQLQIAGRVAKYIPEIGFKITFRRKYLPNKVTHHNSAAPEKGS